MIGILDFIWNATDRDGDGTIDKGEYMIMCRKVYRAIVDDSDSPEADAEIRRIAEEDWDADRQGHDFLDYERFTRAWFQLADHWTHDLSPESYETFLSNIFTTLTERDANGDIVWRSDHDIHHFDPEATTEERDKLVDAGFQDKEIPKKKKRKKLNVPGMDADAMEKYLLRKAKKKAESQGGKVVIVQEGMLNRNTRLAKISSRNGLYIGSVVPPPKEFDDVLTHSMIQKSAFMRIPVKGGPDVYQRGYNSNKDSVALAGQGFVETYPRELRTAQSAGKLAPVLSEEAKAETEYMLQRLWSSSPIGGAGSGRPAGSPGGPSGWLTHFSRVDTANEELEMRIEQKTREQAGVGGGYTQVEESYSSTVEVRRPVTAGPTRDRKEKQRKKSKLREVPSSSSESAATSARPQSAPATRKNNNSSKITLSETVTSNNLLRTNSFKSANIGSKQDMASSLPVPLATQAEKEKKKKRRKKKMSASAKALDRPMSAMSKSSSRKQLHVASKKSKRKKRPMSAASRTRIGRRKAKHPSLAQAGTPVPETDIDPGSITTTLRRRRPNSAHTRLRQNRRTLDGSHMFKIPSREMIEGTTGELQQESRKKKNRPSKGPRKVHGVPKVTLLRLNGDCRRADVAGVLYAMGVEVPIEDIRLTVQNPTSGFRKARVYFRKSYVEYKRAVQMLTIVQRSVDVSGTTPIFERPQQTKTTSSEANKREKEFESEVHAIEKIRVPKMLSSVRRRPKSAHSR